MRIHRDEVVNPGGTTVDYDWFDAADQVRVAAIVRGGSAGGPKIVVVEQHHYLVGPMLQLPGGRMEAGESALTGAQRELAEETGYRGGRWTGAGDLFPLPAFTPMRVHLWITSDPDPGPRCPQPGEQDIRVHELPLAQAVAAVSDGRVRCAPSAALMLLAAARHQ
jgi:ADP-ribose pyrophosphatase